MDDDVRVGSDGPCPACGVAATPRFADCQALWDHLLAESFSNFAYARFHRAIVDAYSLQHPGQYCKSAKSYAAHLTGMCVVVEHDGAPALNAAVQRWLSTNPALDKPAVPATRGRLTAASVIGVETPGAVTTALSAWFHDVWAAYEELHGTAREWIRDATGSAR